MDIDSLSSEEKIYITNIKKNIHNKDEFQKCITEFPLKKIQEELNMPINTQLTGYFLFLSLFREKIKTNNPSLTIPQCAKRCGVIWRALPTNTQNAYKNFL
tara:strand:- start:9854 stop:10156 length:303 start_codon:yes stop_codon:yes gene_type:complete